MPKTKSKSRITRDRINKENNECRKKLSFDEIIEEIKQRKAEKAKREKELQDKEARKKRMERLEAFVDGLKGTEWMYKPIEELIPGTGPNENNPAYKKE